MSVHMKNNLLIITTLLFAQTSFAETKPDLFCMSSEVIDAGYALKLYDGHTVEISAITYLRNYDIYRADVAVSFPNEDCSKALFQLIRDEENLDLKWEVELKSVAQGNVSLKIHGIEIPVMFRPLACEFQNEEALAELQAQCKASGGL